MALSRSLPAGHVLQSPAGRRRKRGQQRHLLSGRDSALGRAAPRSAARPVSPGWRGRRPGLLEPLVGGRFGQGVSEKGGTSRAVMPAAHDAGTQKHSPHTARSAHPK